MSFEEDPSTLGWAAWKIPGDRSVGHREWQMLMSWGQSKLCEWSLQAAVNVTRQSRGSDKSGWTPALDNQQGSKFRGPSWTW